ncbi:MAG: nucleotide exchange factor GrpE [bacterium]|nr:nucleotide exchange factor GrpE [bacterium]
MTEPRDPEHETTEETASGQETPVEETADGESLDEAIEPADEEEDPSPEEALAAERDALHEKWLRAVAEMENVRKRARREVVDARRFAQADLLRPLLAVADDLERALGSMTEDPDATVDNMREGVVLIRQRFENVLKEKGVEVVEAQGAEFDPAVHEAVGQFEREGVEAGVVIEVVQQGYRLGDLLLRPARVIISS